MDRKSEQMAEETPTSVLSPEGEGYCILEQILSDLTGRIDGESWDRVGWTDVWTDNYTQKVG